MLLFVFRILAARWKVLGNEYRGASVTSRFKVAVMEYWMILTRCTGIGAVNTIVNNKGRLIGYNTDWLGLILTLKKAMTVKNKTFYNYWCGWNCSSGGLRNNKGGRISILLIVLWKREDSFRKTKLPLLPLSEIAGLS